jgi:hypothetical protein
MRASIIFIVILAVECGSPRAQRAESSAAHTQYLGVYLGGGGASVRDDLLVPLAFNGPSIAFGGIYSRRSERNRFDVRLGLGAGYLKNRFSHDSVWGRLALRSAWTKPLIRHPKYGEFWGGACLPITIDYEIDHSWDDAHLYWLTSYAAGVALDWKKDLSRRNRATIHLEAPVIGFVSRPPEYRYNKQDAKNHWTFYFTGPNRALQFETLDSYRALFVQSLFERAMGRSLLALGFQFTYDYARDPKEIRVMDSALLLSYLWRIGS